MKAFLDERSLSVTPPTLAAAFEIARAAAQAEGRVIVDVLINGQRASEDVIDHPSDKPAGDIEFKCITADPCALVSQSLREVASTLDSARSAQEEAAGALQQGRMDEAFALIADIMDVWDSLRRVVDQGPALIGETIHDYPLINAAGQPIDSHAQIEQLSTTLQDIKGAVGLQDWSTLADLLSNELDSAADQWVTLLNQMARQTDQQSTKLKNIRSHG